MDNDGKATSLALSKNIGIDHSFNPSSKIAFPFNFANSSDFNTMSTTFR